MRAYQFNGHLLVSLDVGAYAKGFRGPKGRLTMIDVSEGAAAEFAGQSVFSSNSEFHCYVVSTSSLLLGFV